MASPHLCLVCLYCFVYLSTRSPRRTPLTSRTLVSGSSTTLAVALTICTASTVMLPSTTPSPLYVSRICNMNACIPQLMQPNFLCFTSSNCCLPLFCHCYLFILLLIIIFIIIFITIAAVASSHRPRHGWPSPRPQQEYPDHPQCHCGCQGLQESHHHPVLRKFQHSSVSDHDCIDLPSSLVCFISPLCAAYPSTPPAFLPSHAHIFVCLMCRTPRRRAARLDSPFLTES